MTSLSGHMFGHMFGLGQPTRINTAHEGQHMLGISQPADLDHRVRISSLVHRARKRSHGPHARLSLLRKVLCTAFCGGDERGRVWGKRRRTSEWRGWIRELCRTRRVDKRVRDWAVKRGSTSASVLDGSTSTSVGGQGGRGWTSWAYLVLDGGLHFVRLIDTADQHLEPHRGRVRRLEQGQLRWGPCSNPDSQTQPISHFDHGLTTV